MNRIHIALIALVLLLVSSCGKNNDNNFQTTDEPELAVNVGFIQIRMPPDENRTQAQDPLVIENNGDGELEIRKIEWIDQPERLAMLGARTETSCSSDDECGTGEICVTAGSTCQAIGLPATPFTIAPQLSRELNFIVAAGSNELACPEPPADVPGEYFDVYCGALRITTNAISNGDFVEEGVATIYFLDPGASGTIDVDPTFLEFANVQPGTTNTQSFSITNTGENDLTIENINIEDNPTFFTINANDTPVGGTIASGTSASFDVTVSIPDGTTDYDTFTNLVIDSSAGVAKIAVQITSEAGSTPFIELNTPVLKFDAQATQTLTISNVGETPLQVRGLSVNAEARPFYRFEVDGTDVTSNFQTITVRTEESVDVDVIFERPADNTDPSIGTLEIAHNDPNNGFQSEVTLLGDAGDVPIGRIHPDSFTFLAADGNSETRTFVIRNVGTAPLSLNNVMWNFSNGSDAEFSVAGATGSVPAQGIAEATVTFTGMNATTDVGLATIDSDNPTPLTLSLRALDSAQAAPVPMIQVTNQGGLRTSSPVNLSAAGSTPADAVGNAIWTLVARPAGSSVFLDGVGETAFFTPDVAGTYKVALTLLAPSGDREAQTLLDLTVE